MYRSECNAVGEVKRKGSEILDILIQALLNVALFQLVRVTTRRLILLISSGKISGRIMDFYLQMLVSFACFIKS
jgi:hypothetical protein